MKTICLLLGTVFLTGELLAQSHGFINSRRSSTRSNVFVSQALEGEYGKYRIIEAGNAAEKTKDTVWRGSGFQSTLGLEIMKFTQFNISHTFLQMRSKASGNENLTGSRFAGGVRFVFASPIGNLEMGGGASAHRLDYNRYLSNASFYGSGYFYSLGVNYFFSSNISFFSRVKTFDENYVRNGGSSEVENIKTDTNNIGAGFTLWM